MSHWLCVGFRRCGVSPTWYPSEFPRSAQAPRVSYALTVQRCGGSSSIRAAGCVCTRSSASARCSAELMRSASQEATRENSISPRALGRPGASAPIAPSGSTWRPPPSSLSVALGQSGRLAGQRSWRRRSAAPAPDVLRSAFAPPGAGPGPPDSCRANLRTTLEKRQPLRGRRFSGTCWAPQRRRIGVEYAAVLAASSKSPGLSPRSRRHRAGHPADRGPQGPVSGIAIVRMRQFIDGACAFGLAA